MGGMGLGRRVEAGPPSWFGPMHESCIIHSCTHHISGKLAGEKGQGDSPLVAMVYNVAKVVIILIW